MIINGKQFQIYNNDNVSIIIKRIAAEMKTTPYWLWIKSGDLENDDAVMEIVNVENVLEKMVEDTATFKDVESAFDGWINSRPSENEPLKDLAKMYISKFKSIHNFDRIQQLSTLEFLFADSGGIDFDYNLIQNILDKSDDISRDYLVEVRRNKKESDEFTMNGRIENRSRVDLKTTDFEIESEVTSFTIQTDDDVVLSKVFNDIEIKDILFAKYRNFYKTCTKNKNIFEKYDFDSGVIEDLQIVFVIKLTKNRSVFKEIRISEITKRDFRVDIDTLEDEQRFLDIVRQMFNTSITIIETNKSRIKGTFRILSTSFNKILFLDDIMNNDKFNEYVHVNERSKVSKTYNKLHIYFEDFVSKYVVFSLFNDKSDVVVQVTSISSKNFIDSFVTTFIKFFADYKSREQIILKEYQKFLPSLTIENEDINGSISVSKSIVKKYGVSKNPLAEAEPSLFVPLYSRKCAKPPRILRENEDPGDFQTMDYPIYGEGGLKPKRYICDVNKNFIYPGLRKNTLFNEKVFKYLPCCYETNQELRNNSNWNVYFNLVPEKTEKYEHVMYKTSRIVPSGGNGVVPPNIIRVVGDRNRRGVFVGPNSFIDCVCRALGINDYIEDEKQRQLFLKRIRKSLDYRLCSQENYDMLQRSNEGSPIYRYWFENTDLYFEPRRFFRALEEKYKTNIYLFERSTDRVVNFDGQNLEFVKTTNNGILATPNKPENGEFIDPKDYNRTVYIYTHMGGAVDLLKYPHSEYFEFNKTDSVEQVEKVYRYILIKSRKDRPKKITDDKKAEQIIDSTGRCVGFKDGRGDIIDLERPQLPVNIEFCNVNCLQRVTKYDDVYSKNVYMKRFSRIFVEYCAIKYINSSENDLVSFFQKNTTISLTYDYPRIVSRTELAYFDTIFSDNGKIVFESTDTRDRVFYTLQILQNRRDLLKYKNRKYLESYFVTISDFDVLNGCVIVNDLRKFAYETPAGLVFNNYLDIVEDTCFLKLDAFPEISGYYRIFKDVASSVKDGMSLFPGKSTKLFVWENSTFNKYSLNDDLSGKVIVLYKINGLSYCLNKQL